MEIRSCEQLTKRNCVPCEGAMPNFSAEEAAEQIKHLSGWELTHGNQRIRKSWVVSNFLAAMSFFGKVAEISESEGHHPDLHLHH